MHLFCNILGVLFLTNFKSHIKNIIGDPNQNDEEAWEETGECPRGQGAGSQMQKTIGHKCTLISFLFCHYRKIGVCVCGGGWRSVKGRTLIITASDWSGLSLEIVDLLNIGPGGWFNYLLGYRRRNATSGNCCTRSLLSLLRFWASGVLRLFVEKGNGLSVNLLYMLYPRMITKIEKALRENYCQETCSGYV